MVERKFLLILENFLVRLGKDVDFLRGVQIRDGFGVGVLRSASLLLRVGRLIFDARVGML